MLHELVEYARTHDIVTEPGFAPKKVRWAIHSAADGRFLGLVPLGDTEDKRNRGHEFPCCPHLAQPELKRGGAGCRHFLVDTAEVVALLTKGEPDAKLLAKHDYFVGLLRQAAESVPMLEAVVACLEDPEAVEHIRTRLEEQGARPTENVTFAVETPDGPVYPVESDAWHDWWRSFRETVQPPAPKGGSKKGGPTMRCFASGELVTPARTHPKIKGLADVGGLSMGDVLASYKQDSFRSYGLVQSENAAVSEEMASTYQSVLNHLIETASRTLADVKIVHWYHGAKVPAEDDVLNWLDDPRTEELGAQRRAQKLLAAIETGERQDLLGCEYHVLTLSGASGRVMVRDWETGPFKVLVQRVADWFGHLEIVRREGRGMAPEPKLYAVLGGLVRDLKEVHAPLVTTVWRSALRGDRFPAQVLARALARFRVQVITDDAIRHATVGVLKAYHCRKGDPFMKPALREDHPKTAYQCGRLLAVLAVLQRRALGDVGAGLVQRYYAAASATPALVLGRLVRSAQAHLGKLDPGLRNWHENRIAEVLDRVRDEDGKGALDLPATLQLEDQSLFALGYYQQIAHDRGQGQVKRAESVVPDASEIEPTESSQTSEDASDA